MELLVVIAIISILASVLSPVLSNVGESARKAACAANLRGIGLAFYLYISDNNDTLMPPKYGAVDPDAAPLWVHVMEDSSYLTKTALRPSFGGGCPSQPEDYLGVSYLMNLAAGGTDTGEASPVCYGNSRKVSTIEKPSSMLLLIDGSDSYCTTPTYASCIGNPDYWAYELVDGQPWGVIWRHLEGVNILWFSGKVSWRENFLPPADWRTPFWIGY